MVDKFDSVPVEEDTCILFSHKVHFGEYEVLYQKWTWDGITAESLIFVTEDIKQMSNKELEREVKTSPLLKADTDITIKRSDSGFTFVNFNFEI